MNPFILAFSIVVAPFVAADWQYKSRPDLAAPILNITIPATDKASPGYIFAAPFSGFPDRNHHGPRQEGPYIFTDKGELVWSGWGYYSIWAANFQAAKYKGEDILFSFEGSHNPYYGHGHGHITLLNQNYETIKELRAGNHKVSDKHEFHIINEKTALIQIYQPVPIDLSAYGATSQQQWIVNAIFQELDIETGKVLFEWDSLAHVSPAESVLPVNEGQAGAGFNSSDAWDYFHINSVDKDEEGNYLLSARNAASLYKINGTSGDVIWKLGGLPKITSSSFESNFNFSFQHHARWIDKNGSRETISLYDNSAQGTENENGNVVSYSRTSSGKVIEIDDEQHTAKLLKNYLPPDDLLSKSQGSTQILPNGNAIVNWGSSGAVTEFDSDSTPIFHAYFDSGSLGERVENYRAFKFNWTGIPNEDIAVSSELTKDGETKIYVSWNGDTRTKTWRIFGLNEQGNKQLLGAKNKTGFETTITLQQKVEHRVFVESFSENEDLLATSRTILPKAQILKNQAHVPNTATEKFENYFEWRILKEAFGF
ncbi:unnamed protein product [Kluyveromyces dobzhanskii CBS 2104]|uniref:WGS project CCBQ000000000 data, contig 00104 n=1 Tax=Kluyveromyces dobzhanskii CBS 2104 TaxID=1427455 RepID=A0A0A8L3T7_9SACH|nr:unnamed protein product [Kluyveromyces dobzhanskii CBS 2104]